MTSQCNSVFYIGGAIPYVGRSDLSGPLAGHPAVLILSVTHIMQGLGCTETRNISITWHGHENGRSWLLLTVSDGMSWPSGMVAAEKSVNIL